MQKARGQQPYVCGLLHVGGIIHVNSRSGRRWVQNTRLTAPLGVMGACKHRKVPTQINLSSDSETCHWVGLIRSEFRIPLRESFGQKREVRKGRRARAFTRTREAVLKLLRYFGGFAVLTLS